MSEPHTRYVPMPPSQEFPAGHKLALQDRVLVVIGANGSGKTRFGAWLEDQDSHLYHRVAAHRSLSFPERTQPTDLKEAQNQLLFGYPNANIPSIRHSHRWQNKPATALLDDFGPLVTFLVSENFATSDKYRTSMRGKMEFIEPPKTKLDQLKEIWETILPKSELVISGSRIEARNLLDTKVYHAKEMSDGERAVFYLIAEALSVPSGGTFIVDEPELHLHRAIQARLWDSIESARPDCAFVYITHDLGFAASRKDATKVWLRGYWGEKTEWEIIPESKDLPEALLLEVVGSRRPVLFVEGDRSSLDYFIYGKIFTEYTVIPCGSCDQVVHSVTSFNNTSSLHHNDCRGIVDNDGRTSSDVEMLNKMGIGVLPVAIVENLFLLEPIVAIAAKRLDHDEVKVRQNVQQRVLNVLSKNRISVVSNLTRQEIESAIRKIGKCADGSEALSKSFKEASAAIDPTAIYKKWDAEIGRVLKDADYSAALRYYKNKGLASEVGNVFATKYHDQVMRWLRGNDSTPLVKALRSAVTMPSAQANST